MGLPPLAPEASAPACRQAGLPLILQLSFIGADERIRTSKPLRALAPEASAYASSATSA